jgi:hypothetical protein
MSIEALPKPEFLHVRVTGEFALDDANDCIDQILRAVAQHGSTKVLVDCRDLTGTLSTLDRYEHSVYAARELLRARETGVSGGTRFAYVARPPLLSNERFGETVASNRGANVTSTDSLQEALQWLEVDAGDDPSLNDDR